jgi:hypothetical protein
VVSIAESAGGLQTFADGVRLASANLCRVDIAFGALFPPELAEIRLGPVDTCIPSKPDRGRTVKKSALLAVEVCHCTTTGAMKRFSRLSHDRKKRRLRKVIAVRWTWTAIGECRPPTMNYRRQVSRVCR